MINTFSNRMIYVFRINDDKHKGCLKIGETTLEVLETPPPNSDILNHAAIKRIDQYTKTAAIDYELLYTECTTFSEGKLYKGFSDKDVHDVLKKSGVKQKDFGNGGGKEWFVTTVAIIKKAIQAVKEGRKLLNSDEKNDDTPDEIIFRPEQKDAIDKTVKHFKKANRMLWNAKMRFGKTICALEVVKQMKFKHTIIVTHRPVVDDAWFKDYAKIFFKGCGIKMVYGSKLGYKGKKPVFFEELQLQEKKDPETRYIYFASMQDLRGSKMAGGEHNKNNDVFNNNWDCFIIDEAHEGTQTQLGQKVIELLTKKQTKVLQLSGTPFNLLDDYAEDEVFTWDYRMEQEAKLKWEEQNIGSANPYYDLPKLNIMAYNLGELFEKYADGENSFNFSAFFRVDPVSMKFEHENDVKKFLDLLCDPDSGSGYPFSTKEYQNYFRHTLWTLPGVKEARALEKLLNEHDVFSKFEIINVAGEGDPDDEDKNEEALQKVRKAIGEDKDENLNNPDLSPLRPGHYTITLTCGRLTTGVTVKSWTAVFLLSGSVTTSAASYMQTIFRVQSPAKICGKIKSECYVFEFAPDRTLVLISQAIKANTKAGRTTQEDREKIKKFLNFCPVIAMKGSKMVPYDVETMLAAIKRAQIERVVVSGFEDNRLYDFNLLEIDDKEIEKKFQTLKGTIGTTGKTNLRGEIDITTNRVTGGEDNDDDDDDSGKKGKKKKKKLSPKEIEKRRRRAERMAILRGISIRMPLMIYGAEIDGEITIENFTDIIDQESWDEFMPKGVTKEIFKDFSKYYDQEVFIQAGKRIRQMVKEADTKGVDERLKLIALIFSYFRNPDKETVLTPWRVVNMHITDCIGGWSFFDDNFEKEANEPHFVVHEGITENVFKADTKILEINSKTGLYPLFMAYSVYQKHREILLSYPDVVQFTKEKELSLWDKTLKDNIFVICKTPMAASITRRTLGGFRKPVINTKYVENLVEQIADSKAITKLINTIKNGKTFWNTNNDICMKFNAIVGNPPYQINVGEKKDNYGILIFHKFFEIALKLKPQYVSMIFPSRWFNGGRGLEDFRKNMLNDTHLRIIRDFLNAKDVFPSADIAGGINYVLWDANYYGLCNYGCCQNGKWSFGDRKLNEFDNFIRRNEALHIIKKILDSKAKNISSFISSQTPFGFVTTYRGKEKSFKGALKLHSSGGITYVSRDSVKRHPEWIDKYKVIFSKATCEHAGTPDKSGRYRVFSTMRILAPEEICTQSYLVGGVFDSQEESENYLRYLQTRFVRFLVLQLISTQDISAEKFSFVPLQDFSSSSKIKWDNEINAIENQLYKKYKLSDEEIEYIESVIKPME